ncbi:MAG: ribosome biogenesis GTPase Der [Candidatus Dependentiae bacterium]|nr:ribosome biogenesis GTPase Der [Candidatus Dependentiae bacterium]
MSKLPRVVLVGRMNVGKSTLFNRLSTSVKSITLDYEGVTRDFIKDTIFWDDRSFELIDTGGVSLRKTTDPILQEVRARALDQLEKSDVVLFVCDGKSGLVPEDREISKLLHKVGKTVIVVVNKVDTAIAKEHQHEFERLGHKMLVPISAQHGTGISELFTTIIGLIGKSTAIEEEKPLYRVVLLGKPNVGKSSLMNLLLKQERSIVSDVAGTTREAISEKVTFYQEDLQITDTPGLRRQRSVKEQIETLMVKSSLRALDKADIVLLLVDASEGQLADQELKLAFYAFQEHYKALIVLFNKQDLVEHEAKEALAMDTEQYQFLLKKIEQLQISCKTEKNIGKVFPLVKKVWARYSQEFSPEELTVLFKTELEKRPLYHKTEPLAVYRVQQIQKAPITIAMTVNKPEWFGPSQLMFFENVMRATYDLQGVPVKFVLRKRT